MARLPYLEADQIAPEYRDMLKRNTNLHKLLVNSPTWRAPSAEWAATSVSRASSTRACANSQFFKWARMEKSDHESTHHVKIGKEFGVTDEDIAGLIAETEGKPSELEPLARAILRGAREMVASLRCPTPPSPRSRRNSVTST